MEDIFLIDLEKLERNYLNLQRELHPDNLKNQNGKIYQINNAYRILKNPIERAKHLFEINNISIGSIKIAQEDLLKIMDLQENSDDVENQKKIFLLYDECFANMKNAFVKRDFQKALSNFSLLQYLIRLKEKIHDPN